MYWSLCISELVKPCLRLKKPQSSLLRQRYDNGLSLGFEGREGRSIAIKGNTATLYAIQA